MKPREHTTEEMREKFLNHVRALVDFWDKEAREPEPRKKLEGIAFSILVLLDGGSGGHPGLRVIPDPHPDDKQYCIDSGNNYYPEGVDIGGALHERFYPQKGS